MYSCYLWGRFIGFTLEESMKIYHAIISVPNRSKVQDALATLGDCPPSYQDFLDAIKSSPGTTASGSSGLTYAMMKAWPEEVSRLAYDLLAKMWEAKHVPDWWKFRWLAPIPKNPLAPTVDELRLPGGAEEVLDRHDSQAYHECHRGSRGTVGVPTRLQTRTGNLHSQPPA